MVRHTDTHITTTITLAHARRGLNIMRECSNHIHHEVEAQGLYVLTHKCIIPYSTCRSVLKELCQDIRATFSKLMSHMMQSHPLDWKLAPSFQSKAEVCMAEHDRKQHFVCRRKEARELDREGLEMAASLYGDKSGTLSLLKQVYN